MSDCTNYFISFNIGRQSNGYIPDGSLLFRELIGRVLPVMGAGTGGAVGGAANGTALVVVVVVVVVVLGAGVVLGASGRDNLRTFSCSCAIYPNPSSDTTRSTGYSSSSISSSGYPAAAAAPAPG